MGWRICWRAKKTDPLRRGVHLFRHKATAEANARYLREHLGFAEASLVSAAHETTDHGVDRPRGEG